MNHQPQYWKKSKKLMFIMLGWWFFWGFFIHFFAKPLNQIEVLLGFPLGFYLAAQGSLVALVVLVFWYANRQSKINTEHKPTLKPD